MNHVKKIIYISHWRFPSSKTMSPLIMKTCSEFAKNGYEVELWAPYRKNRIFKHIDPFEHHGIQKNFIIKKLPALDLISFGPIGFYILLLTFNISVMIRALFFLRKKPIFYTHDIRNIIFLSFFRVVVFVEIHDFYKSSFDWLNRYVFKKITGFMVTNRIKIEILSKEYGISHENMLHCPNAVDIAKFNINISREDARNALNIKISSHGKIVLYTGHLFKWKGVYTLADSVVYLDSGINLYFVGGTDEDRKQIKIYSHQKKLSSIYFFPHQPHDKIPLYLKAADVLVLPNTAEDPASKYETSPVKLFEYMASGAPIVASDLPSVRDVVDESDVFFFTPDDPRSLADIIMKVIRNQDESETKARYAQKHVENFSWENRTKAITSFISSRN